METFILNCDDSWDFSGLLRRYLLHWHPVLKPDNFLVSRVNHTTTESIADIFGWPCEADEKKLASILINYQATDEFESLKVAALIASENLSDDDIDAFITPITGAESTRYCLFLSQQQFENIASDRLNQLVNSYGQSHPFDLVFITPDENVDRLRLIVLTCDLLSQGDLFHDDFFRDSNDRIVTLSRQDANNERNEQYETAYRKTMGQLNVWLNDAQQPLSANESLTREALLAEVKSFQNSFNQQSLGIDNELKTDIPTPSLPTPGFFYNAGFYGQLKNQCHQFDQKLDNYLQDWFKVFNRLNRDYRENFFLQQKLRISQLETQLQENTQIETDVLEDAILDIEQQIKNYQQNLTTLLDQIRADMSSETKQSIQWNNQQNQNFNRKFFHREERAVKTALKKIPELWTLQPRKRIFWFMMTCAFLLAIMPVAILRYFQLSQYYAQYPFAWVVDISWLLLFLGSILAGLYFSGKKQQQRVRQAVDTLTDKLTELRQRHQQACKAAEDYSICRLYLQELGKVKNVLQKTLAHKRIRYQKLSNLKKFVQNQPTQGVEHTPPAPEQLKDWVAEAIKLHFIDEETQINVSNDLAPNNTDITTSAYHAIQQLQLTKNNDQSRS